ncbi:MAG TPA: phosphoenolpyruvate--protein phosphotransferase [Thermoanaerobaculia bacterium]|nr:phosphoenolpyruvate--protein phosphotransferase [Thermoanaerobaculia bacterium]
MDHLMQVLHGRGVASGVAMGRVVTMHADLSDIYRFPLAGAEEVGAEVERFEEARRRTSDELRSLRTQVDGELGSDLAAIFDAHLLLLEDASFGKRVVDRIRTEQVNAEWAVHKTVEELEGRFAEIENEYLRERNEDVRDVGRQIMRILRGVSAHELSELGNEVIVVADDLTPSEAVQLGRQGVDGFVLEGGGRTSHTTIIARSLNVPLVAGVAGITGQITDNDPVIVNGDRGEVVLHPTPAMLARYRQQQQQQQEREQEMLATCALAACTRDGVEVSLMANIDLPEEIDEVRRFGAAGVGLYRSEFLYIESSPELPSEDDHLAIYRRIVEVAAPFPAVIRTYDLGGRKLAREVMHTSEDNPVLGLRGIRLTLARPDVFRTQLRALFRAGLHGDLWVLLPMVSAVEEVHRFRAFADEVMAELEAEGVPFARDFKLGIMIEVPGAALTADLLAREVDFFAIGTNDLIQYALAVDRNNEHVADLYQPLHPGILRMLRFVVDSAAAAGIEVEICGEMASDPRYAPLLVGLGLTRLSMSPRQVPEVKTRIRQLEYAALRQLVGECTSLASASEVERHAADFFAARRSAASAPAEESTLRRAQ